MKKIPYGIIDYKLLQEENYHYVDKTMYLEKLENVGRTLIYLRPGRFGKSLFTSMLYYYYDVNSKNLFATLFKETYVSNNPTPNKNNYYILKFDFSGIATDNKEMNELENSFKNCVNTGLKEFLKKYNLEYTIHLESNPSDIMKDFLSFLKTSNLKHKLYIIIDEYDNFTNAILEGDGERFLSVVGKSSFVKNFYTNIKIYVKESLIDRVFITGICPITMDSMTTGFNIATNISLDEEFNSMIGLTHKEVLYLLESVEEPEKNEMYELMVQNYDGYLFSKNLSERVFNATLVMYFLKEWERFKRIPENLKDDNIVANFEKIKNIVSLQNNEYYESVLNTTLKTNKINGILKTTFDITLPFTEDDIISLLYYFGYLTIESDNVFLKSINFRVPNKIMSEIYNNFFIEILREHKFVINREKNEEAIKEIALEGTIKNITNYVSEILKETDNKIFIKFDEKYIQLIYFTILRQSDLINVYSEYQTKNGYVDLFIESKNELAKYNIIIELKYIKKKESSKKLIEEKKLEAIEQIKSYSEDERMNKNLRKYIVVFVGNKVEVLEEV